MVPFENYRRKLLKKTLKGKNAANLNSEGIMEVDAFNSSNGFTFFKAEDSAPNLALAHIHEDGLFVHGNLHVNIDIPKYTFDLDGDMRVSEDATFLKTITAKEVTTLSDERLKNNIKKIPNSLAKLDNINGYYFDFKSIKNDKNNKDDENGNKNKCGLIAQEVMKTIPEAIFKDDNGYLSISYNSIIGVLINAIKEIKEKSDIEINELKKIINKII